MSFIRSNSEERTGFQIGEFPDGRTDNNCDFVMVYRNDETLPERIEAFRKKDIVIHFMTGISWGRYLDYLTGKYDGREHWDEAQTDRYGNIIYHGENTPYMVPTVAFADYITQTLKRVVDMGVDAIHVEEPEFWDRAGYSPAFKREYELYYHAAWQAPHESADAKYKCSKLKAYLFTRTIDRVSSAVKEYAKVKYNKELRFYVPTHSLINYTQWKIVSPEGKLSDIPGVDGCIAQVWTGTSREANWFNGVRKERTFETAYLEYGVMQELVKGTGRKMWFLHDPIEDNPSFDWDDYRKNYFCTVTASLLHPGVNSYEICPWPNRVFSGRYPKNSPDAQPIPGEYATILNNMFNTLGTFETQPSEGLRVGILTGDCELYQREYPDSFFSEKPEEKTGTVLLEEESLFDSFRNILFTGKDNTGEVMLKYMSSNAFPGFFSLALPLLKYGIPVRPVLIDNARRFPGYLDDYDVLVLSYEFMKPDYPDINNCLAEWVKRGGSLIYVGDGKDPFHAINSWWTGRYNSPAEHLFEMLGLPFGKEGTVQCGSGTVSFINTNPCVFSFSKENADILRDAFTKAVTASGKAVTFKNNFCLRRGERIIAAVMDESINDEPLTLKGLFADMYAPDFAVINEKTLIPGTDALLTDLSEIKEPLIIIGTSVRIKKMEQIGHTVKLITAGASDFEANIRIKLPFEPKKAFVDGEECDIKYDAPSKTVLLTFESKTGERTITITE